MTFLGMLLRAAVLLWGLSLLIAAAGYVADVSTLSAIAFPLWRLALSLTVLWAVFAGLGAVWQRLRGR